MSLSTTARCVIASGDEDSALIDRVRSEFLEMPGLHLTAPQAARLCGIDRGTSLELLQKLVALGFLRLTVNGAYIRDSNA